MFTEIKEFFTGREPRTLLIKQLKAAKLELAEAEHAETHFRHQAAKARANIMRISGQLERKTQLSASEVKATYDVRIKPEFDKDSPMAQELVKQFGKTVSDIAFRRRNNPQS